MGKKLLPFVIGAAVIAGAININAKPANPATQEIMRGLYDAIAYLLPFSVRESRDISELDQELLDKHLTQLSKGADALASHADSQSESFQLLARSFDEIAGDIDQGFRGQWPAYAYYSLSELTQHCVACHSRLPGDSLAMMGQKLMARINTDEFGTHNLVNLMVATREFDSALSILERELMNPATRAVDLDYGGLLVTYLRIAINVRDQVDRPRALFLQFLNRPDVPHYLANRIRAWIGAMTELRPALVGPADLAVAEQILKTSDDLTPVPGDQIRAVHDLVAANILQRFLQQGSDAPAQQRAAAYYHLGVIALRTFEINFSVPEMEYLFVAAIEADPRGPAAANAYRLLEEFGFVDEDADSDTEPLIQRVVDMEKLRQLAGVSEQQVE